ncbi:LytS/YhcK type 5TM receptor domain-containing protein [Virgibacillus sp. W0181]|uniref:LytS/YhcK type 5TM receptor domain-containing protein n=1 Tax=Virgibacillus sp. W0181 TaxID=3391581 RepID=UPI003F462C2A
MEQLTITFFERIGLLLLFAFLLTRIPSLRYLLDRELNVQTIIYHSILFSVFGIAATQVGVVVTGLEVETHLWVFQLNENEMLVGSSLIAIVIAGLLGGPLVGLGAGLIIMLYLYTLGGEMWFANGVANPISGLVAGFTARFFSHERVIAPQKALFIGMFIPILQMGLLLIFTSTPNETVELVNMIGIPLVITNSIAIAIFTTMIRLALNEKEQEAALETERALKIAEQALPELKQGLHYDTATTICQMLYDELGIAAVSLTDQDKVLAHIGSGEDHHRRGEELKTTLSLQAILTGEIQIAYEPEQIQCREKKCKLQAAIIVPFRQSGETTGTIKLYFRRSQQIRAIEIALAKGLGTLISNQLDVVASEKMKALIQEAELRNLQAQIQPHFLFNTLQSIASLVRVNPKQARHIVVQLSIFMRLNVKMTSISLVPLEQEVDHLKAYLEIVGVRFSDQLLIYFHIDEGITDALIPPFTLQPLVENSIQHGLKNMARNGEIHIRIKEENEQALVEIYDNGSGVPQQLLSRLGKHPLSEASGNGIGVYNVNQRLIHLLGEEASLRFQNLEQKGLFIYFKIPLEVKREGEGA